MDLLRLLGFPFHNQQERVSLVTEIEIYEGLVYIKEETY